MRSFLFGLCLTCAAFGAQAIEVDAAECREGAQFIGNAAQSRKNGISKEFFVGKLEEDLFVLESLPPNLRWFAHGDAEADFLRTAVAEVFEFPREPLVHAQSFLKDCLKSAGINASEAPTVEFEDESRDWNERAAAREFVPVQRDRAL